MTGLVFFLIGTATWVVSAVFAVARTAEAAGWRLGGGWVAVKEGAVLGASLAAYVAVCLLLGFGAWQQTLGCLLGAVVLYLGRRWVPALAAHMGGTDA